MGEPRTGQSTPTGSKPPRMRAACSQCHDAKVRCSGEKTGCTRCLNNGLSCTYEVSMVGRAVSRNKRARLSQSSEPRTAPASGTASTNQTETQDQQAQRKSHSRAQSESHVRSQSHSQEPTDEFNTSPDSSFPSSASNAGMMDILMQSDSGVDMFMDSFSHIPSPGGSTDAGNGMPFPIDFSMDLPNIDLDVNVDQFVDLELATPTGIPSPADSSSLSYILNGNQTPEMTIPNNRRGVSQNSPGVTRANRAQYEHVINLVKIIAHLESQVASKDMAMDKIMRLNKVSLATVMRIVGGAEDQNKMSKSCRALVPTAMELIVTLYEQSLAAERADSQNDQSNNTSPRSPQRRASVLRFGVFQIEPEDQIQFRNQLLIKELQRSNQTIQLLSGQCRAGMSDPSASCGSIMWYNKMEQRCKSLISSLGGVLS